MYLQIYINRYRLACLSLHLGHYRTSQHAFARTQELDQDHNLGMYTCIHIHICLYIHICLCIYRCVSLYCLSIRLLIRPSIDSSIYSSIHSSIHSSIYSSLFITSLFISILSILLFRYGNATEDRSVRKFLSIC